MDDSVVDANDRGVGGLRPSQGRARKTSVAQDSAGQKNRATARFFYALIPSPVQRIPRRSTLPADRKLRLERLTALMAPPRRRPRRRSMRRRVDQPPRHRLVALIHEPQFRRALIRRNIPERTVQITVVQLATNPRGVEQIHPVLSDDEIRRAHQPHVSARSGWLRARVAHTAHAARDECCRPRPLRESRSPVPANDGSCRTGSSPAAA